jgi:hypothetical protein
MSCVVSTTGHYTSSSAVMAHTVEGSMGKFIVDENIVRYRKLIATAEADPSRDEARYQVLLRLLADEEAKVDDASQVSRRSL